MSRPTPAPSTTDALAGSRAEPRAPHVPGDEWVEEGFRQLDLALLWERLAQALERRRGTVTNLAANLRHEAIGPIVSDPWLPGAADLVEKLAGAWKGGKKQGYDPLRFRKAQERYLRQWPGVGETDGMIEAHDAELREHLGHSLSDEAHSTAADPGRPALRRLSPAPSVWSARWLASAIALDGWARLRPEARRRGVDDGHLIELRRMVVDCDRIVEWGEEWRHGSSPFAAMLGQASVHNNAFGVVIDQLTRCREVIEKLLVEPLLDPTEENLREREALIAEVDAQLARTPADWPPRVLSGLQARLREVDAANLGTLLARASASVPPADAGLPRPIGARVALVAALATALDGSSGLLAPVASARAWGEVEEAADRLLDGTGAMLRIDRDPARSPGSFDVDARLEVGRPTRVLTSAIVVDWPGSSKPPTIVRRGVAESSRPVPEVVAPLLEVIGSLTPDDPPDLADRCRKLIAEMDGCGTLGEWWRGRGQTKDNRRRLLRLLRDLTTIAAGRPDPSNAPGRVLEAFAEADFRLEEVEPRADRAGPVQVILADRRGDLPARLGLRTPDGLLFAPDPGLVLPSARSANKLILALSGATVLIDALRRCDEKWPGWETYNRAVFNLAFRPPADAEGVDPGVALAAFKAVYLRGIEPGVPAPTEFRELARIMAEALARMDIPVVPAIDFATGDPAPMIVPPRDGTVVRWVDDGREFGRVEVVRFGVAGGPDAEVRVSLGKRPTGPMARWSVLPAPPSDDLIDRQAGWTILDWHLESVKLPFLDLAAQELAEGKARGRFVSWVESVAGLAWFDRVVRDSFDQGPGVSYQWLEALLAAKWCEVFPDLDEQGRPSWPPERASAEVPNASWSWDESDRLLVVGDSFRYAPSLATLRATFSLGPKRLGGALADAYDLVEAVEGAGASARALGPGSRTLRDALLNEAIGVPGAVNLVARVIPLLDGLADSADLGPSTGDRILTILRALCDRQGLAILPEGWSFSRPTDPDSTGGSSPIEFSGSVEPGRVRVRRLGLVSSKSGDSRGRPASLFRSAGPPPRGLDEFRAAMEGSTMPWAAGIVADLDQWPAAALEDHEALSFKARLLFDHFWDHASARRPEEVEGPSKALEALLAGFGLKTFRPRSTSEHSREYVTVKYRAPNDRGRVTKLHRPGLIHDVDGLCFPAHVDVE